MASLSRAKSLLAGIEPNLYRQLSSVLDTILSSLSFGQPTSGESAGNHAAVYLSGTTHATPSTEFTIAHGLPNAPYLAIPVLPLGEEGAKMVPLTVTRVADGDFIYLSSSVADAPIRLMVEA